MWSLHWISPKSFSLGAYDTPSSCRSLSRQFKFKAPAGGCLSHFYKGIPCHLILKDVTLTSHSKKNNTGRLFLSLDVSLTPGWSKQALSSEISDFTELHWQTGPVLSTEKENALEQCEYMRDQQGCKNIHQWTKYRKGRTNPGKSSIKSFAERES